MADTKISGMTTASALTGAEVLPVVQSAANVKATAQQVVDAAMTTGLTRQALGSINTNTTIDWSAGSYATATITGALTFTFSNPAASGKACVAYLQLTNGGSAVITWPGSVTWSGGTAPTLRASGVDLLRFYTQDGGTTWFGTSENDEPDTTGLTEPLTTPRFIGQTSVPSAASAGEVKAYVRQLGKAFAAAYRGEVGDHVLLLPSLSHPLVRGQFVASGITVSSKSMATAGVAGTPTGSSYPSFSSLLCLNMASASTQYAQAGRTTSTNLSDSQGFMCWMLVGFPDVSYGSGATGTKATCGVCRTAVGANATRLDVIGAVFEYNTNESDANWMACVRDSSGLATPVDTGLAFSPQSTYLFLVFIPRGGSETYFYAVDLKNGTSGTAEVAKVPADSLIRETAMLTTLTTTARNIRCGDIFTLIGGAI